MNCQQINELIYDYCDNKVNPETAIIIEKHLRECPFCRNNEKLTRMENEALHDLENSSALLPGFTGKVMASIDKEYYNANKGSISKLRRFNQLYKDIPKIAVVVVILLVITAGFVFNNSILEIGSNNRIADNSKQANSISSKQEDIAGLSQRLNKTSKNSSFIDEDKSLIKTDLSSVNNKEITICNDSKQTSVSNQGTFLKSTESPRIRSVQLRLEPVNIPSKYELTNIADNKQNITFSYTTINQISKFAISISPESAEETLKASSYAPENDNCQPSLGSLSSPVSWKIRNNDLIYTVTLIGNLTTEELQELVNSISFEDKPLEN